MSTAPKSYTPEPWRFMLADPVKIPYVVKDRDDGAFATVATFYQIDGDNSDHANAERAVACVNACAGITDPAATLAEVRLALSDALEFLNGPDACEVYPGSLAHLQMVDAFSKLDNAARKG